MSSLAEFLFPAPAPRRAPAIVGWWERRRAAYNLMVGGAGAYSLVVIHVFGLLPPDPHVLGGEPLWWVPMVAPCVGALLGATGAGLAVISAGKGNRYGHPHPIVLARLDSAGVRVLRTDRDGTLVVRGSADGRIDVEREREGG